MRLNINLRMWEQPLVRRGVYVILSILALWLLVRSCSTTTVPKAHYRVARDTTWYPLSLRDKEQNMVGFSDELFTRVAKQEDVPIEVLNVGSDNLIFGLDHDQYEGILSSMAPDISSGKQYIFSEPFYSWGLALITRSNSSLTEFTGLGGKLVGIPKDIILPPLIAEQRALFRPYDLSRKSLEDLSDNRIDAVIMDYTTAKIYEQGVYQGKIKIVVGPLLERGLRLVVRRNNLSGMHLVEIFNRTLDTLRKDGEYNKIVLKWSLFAS